MVHIFVFRDNYSKPTCGMTRFHFAYPWFKTLHFAYLNFNSLPTSPSDVRKTHFYSKLEHNMNRKHEPLNLFLTNPRNTKIPCIELGQIFSNDLGFKTFDIFRVHHLFNEKSDPSWNSRRRSFSPSKGLYWSFQEMGL